MKVLILNASPRKNGSTSKVLRTIEEGISEEHNVEWVDVNNLNIKPCIGCKKCRPDKKCVLEHDDAHRVGELINDADVFIVGSPTYWGNMTGPLKILFDRCVPIFEYIDGFNIKPIQKGKKALLVVTSAAPFPFNMLSSQSRGAVRSLKTVLKSGGYSIMKVINISGTDSFEKRSEKIFKKAKKIGESI